ncbi:MAG: ABC-F type ribosomal protection protein [Clostridia bacterium]|nr:ABC-F type ribosomal protection protein [Clostridia bacterium]
MSLINVSNLSFGYDGSINNVFENVSFNIDTDWKLGLIGRNGKGKTTFLKLLLGKYEYQGTISKNVEFDYFPFEINDKERMSIEIVNEIAPNADDWEIIKELNLLNADTEILYRSFNLLSGGEQIKILLISLFLKGNNFLLIDEPTNHLDMETRDNLIEYLNKKKSFILVSHDRNFLDRVVDHIISINNTNIDVQKGNFSSWQENKQAQDNFELTQNEKLKKDIDRLQIASRNAAKWSSEVEKSKYNTTNSGSSIDKGYVGHMSAKMMKKSKVIEKRTKKAIDEKANLLKNIDRNDALKITPLENKRNPLIITKDLQIQYQNNAIFNKISFEINDGDRVAITGKNGIGKSSILKLLMGNEIQYNGNLQIINDLKISYVSQSTECLKGNLKEFASKNQIDESIFKAMLSKMGFTTMEFDRDIEQMSEGQKKKVLIAKSIVENANIYIWDEPLNYIDILTRIQIEETILKYRPTLIFVEHDETFIKNVATKVIELKNKCITT